jgi:hypothetical protein
VTDLQRLVIQLQSNVTQLQRSVAELQRLVTDLPSGITELQRFITKRRGNCELRMKNANGGAAGKISGKKPMNPAFRIFNSPFFALPLANYSYVTYCRENTCESIGTGTANIFAESKKVES